MCVSTTVTFYQDDIGSVTGDGPTPVTPPRCTCYDLGGNGYSGFSFSFQPYQLVTYTGAGCTGHVHYPQTDTGATCFNGSVVAPAAVSTDLYCDSFGADSDFVEINDQLRSMEVCDAFPAPPPSPSPPQPPPPSPPPVPSPPTSPPVLPVSPAQPPPAPAAAQPPFSPPVSAPPAQRAAADTPPVPPTAGFQPPSPLGLQPPPPAAGPPLLGSPPMPPPSPSLPGARSSFSSVSHDVQSCLTLATACAAVPNHCRISCQALGNCLQVLMFTLFMCR